jgi:glycosyltransferase involved in cell wall biosynthesis
MKQNLLYIVTKLELGGAQKHALDLIRHADRGRFNVFLFTAQDGILCQEARSIPALNVHFSRFLERPVHMLRDGAVFFEILSFVRQHHITVVHTHSSKAGILGRWAAWLGGARVIIHTVHGWSFNEHQPFPVRALYRGLERVTAKITDKIIVVSSWDRDKGVKSGIGSMERYALVSYGIDISAFEKKREADSLRREFGLHERDLVVGSIACLKKQKAPQDFIKLARLVKEAVPGVKFLLAGDGELKEDVRALRQRFGLDQDVFLLGWQKDIPRFLEALDVFVLTSLWEGLPICVIEAMASSKPVLVTDTGGVRDVVSEGQTGYLAPVHDMGCMKEKLVMLLTDPARRRQCADAGRRSLTKSHRLETMTKDIFAIYEGLVNGKDGAHAG